MILCNVKEKKSRRRDKKKKRNRTLSFRRDIMEAAFDGEVDKIKEIMGKVNIWLMLSHIFKVDFIHGLF